MVKWLALSSALLVAAIVFVVVEMRRANDARAEAALAAAETLRVATEDYKARLSRADAEAAGNLREAEAALAERERTIRAQAAEQLGRGQSESNQRMARENSRLREEVAKQRANLDALTADVADLTTRAPASARVVAVSEGVVVISGGSRDGLAVGDAIECTTKEGATVRGVVDAVFPNYASVRFDSAAADRLDREQPWRRAK